MALSILGPFNDLINKTATAIIDNHVATDVAKVVNAVVNAGVDVVDDTLKKIQDITKP